MFNPDTRELIQDVLRMFAQATHIPMEMYELGDDGNIVGSVRSDNNLFPKHCHAIWNLENGKGRKRCEENMCKRAAKALLQGEASSQFCHAGLTNLVQPILVDGKPVAAIQYGTFRNIDEDESITKQRLEIHAQAMIQMGATEAEAEHIRQLLVEDTPQRSDNDWKVVRETLAQMLSRIIERDRRIRQGAYHDLHMRLTSALWHAQLFCSELPPNSPIEAPVTEIVGAIRAAGTVMHNLTHGHYLPQDYRYTPEHIRESIQTALSLCIPEASSKGIEIQLDLQPNDGLVLVEGSWRHLQHAFNNLVHNAVKYSYRTTPTSKQRFVSIRGRLIRSGYEISVENYGIGIERDEYDKVFLDGYKGRLMRAEYRTGSGHGLALTKRVIDKHGGTITLSSEPVRDIVDESPYRTRFVVWLPLKHKSSTSA